MRPRPVTTAALLRATPSKARPTAEVLASRGNVAVVLQDSDDPMEAVGAALVDAGAHSASDVTVIEVPAPEGSDGGSLFIVLWERAARFMSYSVQPDDGLTTRMMTNVLTAGNVAFGVPPESDPRPRATITRWLAMANPTRSAWEALDRFFAGKHESR